MHIKLYITNNYIKVWYAIQKNQENTQLEQSETIFKLNLAIETT